MIELSERLCELVGIEPKLIGCKLGSTCSRVGSGCKSCNKKTPCEHYPNFESPENFVKLIELKVSKKLIVGRYFQGSGEYGAPFSNQWYDRESFLNILIGCLSRTDEWCARNRNRIIQTIQSEEWSYDQ